MVLHALNVGLDGVRFRPKSRHLEDGQGLDEDILKL